MLVKLDRFPRDEDEKYLKPPPRTSSRTIYSLVSQVILPNFRATNNNPNWNPWGPSQPRKQSISPGRGWTRGRVWANKKPRNQRWICSVDDDDDDDDDDVVVVVVVVVVNPSETLNYNFQENPHTSWRKNWGPRLGKALSITHLAWALASGFLRGSLCIFRIHAPTASCAPWIFLGPKRKSLYQPTNFWVAGSKKKPVFFFLCGCFNMLQDFTPRGYNLIVQKTCSQLFLLRWTDADSARGLEPDVGRCPQGW